MNRIYNLNMILFLTSKSLVNYILIAADQYVGQGIKRMKAYVSQIPEDELKRKISDFWSSRCDNDTSIWEALKELCEESVDSGI